MPFPEHTYDDFLLEFSAIALRRGNKELFSGLSFRLQGGELLWVQGDNGIGKTSILKLALGIWRADEGQITHSINNSAVEATKCVAYLGHHDAFEPLLNVSEALKFWARLYRFEGSVDSILSYVGLPEQKQIRIKNLSAGQKRRLALGRIVMTERPLWVLDEPKAAMDKKGQSLIDEMLEHHVGRGGAALVASHDKTIAIGQNARRLLIEAM